MIDNEIIEAVKEFSQDKTALVTTKGIITFGKIYEFISRLQADKEALIAGQETLQKALVEKNAEIEKLESRNNFLEFEYKNQGNLFWARVNRAKAEAIKEFAERLKKLFDVLECQYFDEDITMNTIRGTVDNLVKEMVGD